MKIIFNNESEYHFTTIKTFRDVKILTLPTIPEMLLQYLNELRTEFEVSIYGYVIMPNHIHFIWHISSDPGISVVMKHYKGWTGGRIVPQLETIPGIDVSIITRKGGSRSLWKRSFYDFNLISERKFLEKLEYIHQNPVRWGLTLNPGDWAYSSFRAWYGMPDVKFEIDRI